MPLKLYFMRCSERKKSQCLLVLRKSLAIWACRWTFVENTKVLRNVKYAKILLVIFNTFEFSHVREIMESWLVHASKFSWIIKSCFLTEIITQS